jgi:hypothetical protein
MNTSAQWRTKSYLLLPDVGSQMSFGSAMHTATMQQTQPRFGSNYFDASGPGPKYNTPHDRGIFQKPYLRKHTTFSRSDRFAYVDAFSASRGIPDRCSPGPGRYPASQSSFDKHVRSTERLKPGTRACSREPR